MEQSHSTQDIYVFFGWIQTLDDDIKLDVK